MKKLILIAGLLLILLAGFAIYLVATTPTSSPGVRFPLTPQEHELVAHVPRSADAFALIPVAAALDSKLRANRITRNAIDEWSANHVLPQPWMVGSADLLIWREGKQTRYLLRLDPLRASIVRLYQMIRGDSGGTLLINAPPSDPIAADEITQIERLAQRLPAGDAFVVQRDHGKGAYPPLARPAATSIAIHPDDVTLTSRAANESSVSATTLTSLVPRGSLLAATFATPPRAIGDLNRLFAAKVSTLLENGGTVALYDIDTGTLLPRPLGVIALPASDPRRAELLTFVKNIEFGELLGIRPQTAERDGQLLLSFDKTLPLYIKDAIDTRTVPAAVWAIHADAHRLAPILEKLKDNPGLRLAAPHLFRSARDLQHWIRAFEESSAIDAVDTIDGDQEQIEVRIAAR